MFKWSSDAAAWCGCPCIFRSTNKNYWHFTQQFLYIFHKTIYDNTITEFGFFIKMKFTLKIFTQRPNLFEIIAQIIAVPRGYSRGRLSHPKFHTLTLLFTILSEKEPLSLEQYYERTPNIARRDNNQKNIICLLAVEVKILRFPSPFI